MKKRLFLNFLLLALAPIARSQTAPKTVPLGTVPSETYVALAKIDQAFDDNLKEKGWTRERYTPFQPSSGLAEQWKIDGRSVRIFIAKLGPAPAELHKDKNLGEPVEGICDEATVFGFDGNISCRHGELGVSISSAVHLTLWSKEASGIEQAEAKATSKLIACFVNLALDGKLTKKWPHRDKPVFVRTCELELMYRGLIGEEVMKQYTGNRW